MSELIITEEVTDNKNGNDFYGRIKLDVSEDHLAALEAHADGEGDASAEDIYKIVIDALNRYKENTYEVFDACESSWSLVDGNNDFTVVMLD